MGELAQKVDVGGERMADTEALPVSPVLTWSNIKVNMYPKPGFFANRSAVEMMPPKKILRRVTGMAESGRLMAIMGASGAGKSTLLDVLSARPHIHNQLEVHGKVLLDGKVLTPSIAKESVGYVEQHDWVLGTLTVKEHMWFQAVVRLGDNSTKEDRAKIIDEVILQMGLQKCKDTLIRAISGGQKKRLSVATVLIGSPQVMLVDEPTTGLDAYMAFNVITSLKKLADSGRVVIATIHTPSSQLYYLFDDLLLMADGREVYIGPMQGATDFFREIGYECPLTSNPADFFVATLAVVPWEAEERRKRNEQIADKFEFSQRLAIIRAKLASIQATTEENVLEEIEDDRFFCGQSYKTSWLTQMHILMWRASRLILRNPRYLSRRVTTNVLLALFFGLVWLNSNYNQQGIQSMNGCLFYALMFASANSVTVNINAISTELPVFLREHSAGLYRTDSFFLSRMVLQLPLEIIVPWIYATVFYWMVGLYPTANHYLMCMCIYVLVDMAAASFGQLLSVATGNLGVALALSHMIIPILPLLGGFFINIESIPPYISWLNYILWYRFGAEALYVNQWTDVGEIECTLNDTSACFVDGKQVLDYYSFDDSRLSIDLVGLFLMLVGYRIVTYFFLLLKTYSFGRKRN